MAAAWPEQITRSQRDGPSWALDVPGCSQPKPLISSSLIGCAHTRVLFGAMLGPLSLNDRTCDPMALFLPQGALVRRTPQAG